MRLVSIVASPRAGKKWRATFQHDDTTFHTDFGASGYEDYTQHKDSKRAASYKARHRKDLLTKNYTKPGYLSWYLLWDGQNFRENVANYKNKFHL